MFENKILKQQQQQKQKNQTNKCAVTQSNKHQLKLSIHINSTVPKLHKLDLTIIALLMFKQHLEYCLQ